MSLKFRGRPPIRIADSVQDVARLRHLYAQALMSRTTPLTHEMIDAIRAQSLFTWEGRNPEPALDEDGNFQGTDLDLLSFLVPMAEYGAVIEIPQYRNRRKIVRKQNERKIGTNQFGPIQGLTSHRDVFSFSARIHDNTIVQRNPETQKETIGAWRNYMIVDCDGHWYDGWDRIVWNPTADENAFLSEKGLWTGNTVYFRNYMHPNRWQSVFGAPYLLAKMLIARIDDEAVFYRTEIRRLEGIGLTLPKGEKAPFVPPISEGETTSIPVDTMEMPLVVDAFHGSYPRVADTQDGLAEAYRRQRYLTYTQKPKVQFITRADEVAYFKFGLGKIAHWMRGRTWTEEKIKRTTWQQMVLSNDVALRYRIKTVSQQVSAA